MRGVGLAGARVYQVPRPPVVLTNPAALPGFVAPFKIDRNADLADIQIDLRGTITLSGAGANATASALAPAQIITSVALVAGAGRRIQTIDGRILAWMDTENLFSRFITAPGGAAGAQNLVFNTEVALATKDWPAPVASALHTRPEFLPDLELDITFNNPLNMYSSNVGALTVSACNLTLQVTERRIEYQDPNKLFEQRWVKHLTPFDITFAAAGPASSNRIQIPQGEYLRNIRMMVLDSTTGEPSDAKINFLNVRAGSDRRLDQVPYWTLRGENQRDDWAATTWLTGQPGILDIDVTGINSYDGDPSTYWDLTRAPTDTFIEVDTQGNANTRCLGVFVSYQLQPALKAG